MTDTRDTPLPPEASEADEGARTRALTGLSARIVFVIAVLWSLFQLSIASWWILDSVTIRCVHLSFALMLAFLTYPWRRRGYADAAATGISRVDLVLAGLGALAALYLALDYVGIAGRQGSPILRDLLTGFVMLLLLLEATRRVVGPALPLICSLFCIYSFVGPHMPHVISFKGVSLGRFVGQMTMSTEGIYGIPLHVSASVVFLFVLFGAMLEKAGAGAFFLRLALSLLGGFRGGPAKAAILSSASTGLFSGSSIANIVTTGTFTIPMMKRVGYPAKKAAAIEVAASTDGQLMPPIMGAAAFIIAEYVNVPYLEVVKAAAIPALASYAALFYITHLEACKLGLRGLPREELPRLRSVLSSGWHYLVPLAFLLYQLIVLRRSPDASVFNGIWLLALIMLIQRPIRALAKGEPMAPALRLGVEQIMQALSRGARNMVAVALATAAAGVIVGVVTMGLGGLVTEVIDVLSGGNILLMLIITAIASLILGMGLPTTATYIVMASLTARAMVELAAWNDFVMPLLAAHLFCFYFGILADDTPPVGLAAYAASAIARSAPIPTGLQGFMYDIRTAIIPFMFVYNTDIILHGITSWPLGILILVMTSAGACSFAAATQGWFITRNRWYDTVLLLAATFSLMRPDFIAQTLLGDPALRHATYPIGLTILAATCLLQRARRSPNSS
ncbi:TRAP transporter permease [Candidatus Fermentibacteria bacterium]|nr:TRAP transporter permease [Candidatus Fermentibacteria bacterium]